MKNITQYIRESITNIDKYYNEDGERKDHSYSLHKLKKGDPIYLLKDRNADNIVELKVSKVETGKNTDEGAWWATQYKCKVYVEKNDEGIEYFFSNDKSENGPFTGWFNTSIYILRVGTMFTDKRTNEYGGFLFSDIALDKEDIEDRYGELSQEIKDELKRRRSGWPEKYIKNTLVEFKKYENKKPEKTYNTTVGMLVKWLRQGGSSLDDWMNIQQLIKYCFNNNDAAFKKFLKINDKREIEIKQYSVSDTTPEVVLLLSIDNYPIILDAADEDDDYQGLLSLETFISKKSKKGNK